MLPLNTISSCRLREIAADVLALGPVLSAESSSTDQLFETRLLVLTAIQEMLPKCNQPESAYRILVALGSLLCHDSDLKTMAVELDVLTAARELSTVAATEVQQCIEDLQKLCA